MSGGSCHLGAGGNRHQLEFRAIGSEGQLMIDLERDEFWLYRVDGNEVGPALEPNALLYDCDGPPNTLVDLALGRDVVNYSPGELGARARRDRRRRVPQRAQRPVGGDPNLTGRARPGVPRSRAARGPQRAELASGSSAVSAAVISSSARVAVGVSAGMRRKPWIVPS